MRGDEERVVAAYASWLEQQGWRVRRDVDFVDVYAERGQDKLYAEAMGQTAAIGLDVDTLYGQLLRRMKDPGANDNTQSWSLRLRLLQFFAYRPGFASAFGSSSTK
jgi:hypothetical protein